VTDIFFLKLYGGQGVFVAHRFMAGGLHKIINLNKPLANISQLLLGASE
jgi:hypothetical protein